MSSETVQTAAFALLVLGAVVLARGVARPRPSVVTGEARYEGPVELRRSRLGGLRADTVARSEHGTLRVAVTDRAIRVWAQGVGREIARLNGADVTLAPEAVVVYRRAFFDGGAREEVVLEERTSGNAIALWPRDGDLARLEAALLAAGVEAGPGADEAL